MSPESLPWPAELESAADGGWRVPEGFGDPAAETDAVLKGTAATLLPSWSVVSVQGSDRAPFLNRLLTAEIATLEEGRATPCLLLDNKGRVQACFLAVPAMDSVMLFGEAEPLERARETLGRYVLAADVELERGAHAVLALGKVAADRAGAVLEASPDTLARTADDTYVLATDGMAAWRALAPTGAEAVGAAAAELWRVVRLWPAAGAELTGREFPQELGLESAVDFNKGCYLGQETVARIHYRGGVNRLLCRLRGGAALAAGEELRRGDRRVGIVTSAAPVVGEAGYSLALVATDDAEAGVELATTEGVAVTVDRVAGTTET